VPGEDWPGANACRNAEDWILTKGGLRTILQIYEMMNSTN
jgi:hypothetical protein